MKINQKILSLPPYISTSWKNVLSLHLEKQMGCNVLKVGLVNGSSIDIPDLDSGILDAVFTAHEKYLELESTSPAPQKPIIPPMGASFMGDIPSNLLSIPLHLGLETNMEGMLQHNPDAALSPELPEEVLNKIASLSKVIGFENGETLPKPEPHCNCIHCQIMRVILEPEQLEEAMEEEEISEDDLRFRDWDIKQTSDQLYIVANPLNSQEQYNVFLGEPVGCTCGAKNCEHIRAVLNS